MTLSVVSPENKSASAFWSAIVEKCACGAVAESQQVNQLAPKDTNKHGDVGGSTREALKKDQSPGRTPGFKSEKRGALSAAALPCSRMTKGQKPGGGITRNQL